MIYRFPVQSCILEALRLFRELPVVLCQSSMFFDSLYLRQEGSMNLLQAFSFVSVDRSSLSLSPSKRTSIPSSSVFVVPLCTFKRTSVFL